ncbi:MAG: YetF domain-containing protein [Solirubrobacterales bacterium]
MLLAVLRTLILFTFVVLLVRVMGKRQIGQLQPYELVIIIMISELAAIPMQDTRIPLLAGLIPILVLATAQVAVSYAALKSDRARGVICGRPSVLIENGKIVEEELRRQRYNINDLLEQLRSKDAANIADVEYAILETSGQLSIIPKSQKRPVNPEDLNLSTPYEGLPTTLIIDGRIFHDNLKKIGLTPEWLFGELTKLGIRRASDVLFASLDTEGRLYYQLKQSVRNRPAGEVAS